MFKCVVQLVKNALQALHNESYDCTAHCTTSGITRFFFVLTEIHWLYNEFYNASKAFFASCTMHFSVLSLVNKDAA